MENPKMISGRAGLALALNFALIMTLTVSVLTPGPNLGVISYDYQLPRDQRAGHYEWKLNSPTTASRVSARGFYGLHQLLAWIEKRIRPTT